MIKIKNKNVLIIICIILSFIFLLLASFINVNKMKATINRDMLVFKDENLYNCALVSYIEEIIESAENEEDTFGISDKLYDNYENFPVKEYYEGAFVENLSKESIEQLLSSFEVDFSNDSLKKIKELSCSGIKDYTGIDSLESLEYLELEGNIESLDLSNNKKLELVNLNMNVENNEKYTINNIVLPISLETLQIKNSVVSNSIIREDNLKSVYLQYTEMDELVFSEKVSFQTLYVTNSKIEMIDLGKVNSINSLTIGGEINNLILPEKMNDIYVSIGGNVKNIEFPKDASNISFDIHNNNVIDSIDLSYIDSINSLNVTAPNLKNILFKENISVNYLNIQFSDIKSLDMSKININNIGNLNGVKKVKLKDGILGKTPNYLEEISMSDGSYIKLNSNKVMFGNEFLVFKDKELTINDVIENNNIIEKNGLEFNICSNEFCQNDRENPEFAGNLKLKDLAGKYLNIYKDDIVIKSYKIDVMDNEYFDDYFLYKMVLSSANLGDYTAIDVDENKLQNITNLGLNTLDYIKNYKGLEKLTGLKSLYIGKIAMIGEEQDFPRDILESFAKLEILNLYNIKVDTLDLSNLVELKSLTMYSTNINNFIVNNNHNLEAMHISLCNIKNIKLFENNINNSLKTLSIYSSKIANIDVSNLLNLNYLDISSSDLEYIDISKNVLLTELTLDENKLETLNIDNNINLKSLSIKNNKISNLNLNNNINLEYLNIDYNNIEKIDFTNNSKLKTVKFYNNRLIKEIKGVQNIPIDDDFLIFPELELIELNQCKNIDTLFILSNKLKTLDVSGCDSLAFLVVISSSLEEIKGLEDAQNLYALVTPYSKINSLDISSLSNLGVLNIQFSAFNKNNMNMLVGESKKINWNIKLPEQITLEHYNEDDYYAEYENGLIIANNPGKTVVSSYFPTFDFTLNELSKASIKTTVNVYDIKSNKFMINKEYKYIFNENNEKNKVLNRYIKVYGENVSKKIESNKLYMYSGDKKIFTFDILEFTSDDYKIDNNKNIIIYSDDFDISKLNVVNGSLNKIDDEIQLICNDSIVKTYKLEKK